MRHAHIIQRIQQMAFELITHLLEMLQVCIEPRADDFTGFTQPDNFQHILRACSPPTFMTSTMYEAGYVAVKKEFQDRKPVTWYSLLDEGRTALKSHLDALQTLIHNAGLQ